MIDLKITMPKWLQIFIITTDKKQNNASPEKNRRVDGVIVT
ncbi:hypothetical protein PCIT_b0801 [Pseudoalteromonas citrea]|uniref:Uncharacterized protein n=1 Tax=Pseudoalteromonas citrea TaxID=43655 RepID=A0AAD4FQ39_9GAMM|nr:hypothetical protein PCIT_b0801 [Pseudoalteromonas citrea]